jgi:hypothetical protein
MDKSFHYHFLPFTATCRCIVQTPSSNLVQLSIALVYALVPSQLADMLTKERDAPPLRTSASSHPQSKRRGVPRFVILAVASILVVFVFQIILFLRVTGVFSTNIKPLLIYRPRINDTPQQQLVQRSAQQQFKCMVFLHVPKVGGRATKIFVNSISDAAGIRHHQYVYGESRGSIGEHLPRFLNNNNNNNRRILEDPRVHRRKRFRRGRDIPPQHDYNFTVDSTGLYQNFFTDHTLTIGHFTTRLFDLKPELKECFTFTVLREPVDRAISAYYFHSHTTEEVDNCTSSEMDRRMTCIGWWKYSNDYTRRFAGLPDTEWNTYNQHKLRATEPNATHLEYARQKLLNDFDLVCFLQDLPSCALKIMETFRVDPQSVDLGHLAHNKNNQWKTGERDHELSEDSMHRFREANEFDSKLYEMALTVASSQ